MAPNLPFALLPSNCILTLKSQGQIQSHKADILTYEEHNTYIVLSYYNKITARSRSPSVLVAKDCKMIN